MFIQKEEVSIPGEPSSPKHKDDGSKVAKTQTEITQAFTHQSGTA